MKDTPATIKGLQTLIFQSETDLLEIRQKIKSSNLENVGYLLIRQKELEHKILFFASHIRTEEESL